MIKRILELGNLDIKKSDKAHFFKELRGLVSIFFAVVIGLAFQEFNKDIPSHFSLIVAFIVICLSWWGYFFGITCGPKELNVWNIIIDCFLLVSYWLLLNMHEYQMCIYPFMFFLYFVWEWIRWTINDTPEEKELLRKAMSLNFCFFFYVSYVMIYFLLLEYEYKHNIPIQALPLVILCVAVLYRFKINKIYSDSRCVSTKTFYVEDANLINEAKRVAQKAHVSITNYKVGAAILVKTGDIYSGCNIEFDNLSNTIHAEESAISSMIASGNTQPVKIAVYTEDTKPAYPCGMCLQSLFELSGENLTVIACNDKHHSSKQIAELLPFGFTLES